MPDTVRVDGPADHAFVDAVHGALDTLWQRLPDVDDADRQMFALAVVEIATNIVRHTVHPSSAVEVSLAFAADDSLHALFSDDGMPVDVDLGAVRMPDPDAESGRGLALAQAALDDLSLERADGRNVWRLRRERR